MASTLETPPSLPPARRSGDVDTDALVASLRAAVAGEVDASTVRRAQYSTDASNYRVVPQVVVFPRSTDDVLAALEVARAADVPITSRGAGTSVAGNAVGTGMVLDFSRHLNRIHEIDPEARTARVEPGVVMSSLQTAAAPHGLRFGPDPSTQNRATLGGMIGNNACGPHAVAYGRTADNTLSLDVVDGTGRRFTAGAGAGALDAVPGLDALVTTRMALIRTELGRFGRQVSGYSLEHLLPENGTDLAKALVGTEGTVATILGATVRLHPTAAAPVLVCLGYPDMAAAADDVPALLALDPLAIEGLDARLVEVVRRHKGDAAIPPLPPGGGWLMVEVTGADVEEALGKAYAIAEAASTDAKTVLPPGPDARAMWQIRADGAGLGGRTPAGNQAWPGWEDAAVPPARLGTYLREYEALMASYGVEGLMFGHFGDGCIHVRLDIPLEHDATVFRRFITDSATLVASHGGSLSGEHGDGRARGELLPLMYSPAAIEMFAEFKALLDPADVLNPGIIVRPAAIDADLRRPAAAPLRVARPGARGTGFAFTHDGGDVTTAVHRCTGVGKCRADSSGSGGFMCPSYQATKDETDVTRGRSRVLQEMLNGRLVTGGWRSPEVHAALDLCLSCKACSRDCPAGVDMAALKSEALFHTYRGRVRPVDHYALGWLPRWTRLVTAVPGLAAVVNAVLGVRPVAKLVMTLGGMDSRRTMVSFANEPFRKVWRRRRAELGVTPSGEASDATGVLGARAGQPLTPGLRTRTSVVLWTDSFSDSLAPSVPEAAVRVLVAAGYDVIVPEDEACCGLTWISTGQLDGARKRLEHLLGVLGPFAVNGVPIVGLEPSCTGVLRSDLLELLPDDPRSHAVARATHTLAELLTAPAPVGPDPEVWQVPDLSDVTAVVQPHCHHHSVMGFATDEKLLRDAGASITTLAGCCGLAGNFGMQKGHYDVSVQVAENALLPALRAMDEGDTYLADGYSCRTQAQGLADVRGKALAELIAEHLPGRDASC